MAFSIDSKLLPIKAHFFLFFGGNSPVLLFMATFAKQLGFSSMLVGSIFTVLPLLSTFGKLIIGPFADKFNCHKVLLIFYLTILTLSVSMLTFITPLNNKFESELICNQNSAVRVCSHGKTERCTTTKIKTEYHENKTLNCKMDCAVNKDLFATDCNFWMGSQHCQTLNTKNITKIPMENGKVENNFQGSASNIATENTLPSTERTISHLSFDVSLLPHGVKQEGNCFLIDIGGVKDHARKQENLPRPYCETQKEFSCQMVCENPVLSDIGKSIDKEGPVRQGQFWFFTLSAALILIAIGSISCLGETICFGLLDNRPSEFGKQRLWGSLGWGIMSLIGGTLTDLSSGNKAKKDYRPIFYVSVTLLGLDLFAVSRIKDVKKGKSESIVWDIGNLFTNIRAVIYIIWCIFAGMSNGIIMNFLFWYLEDLQDCDGLNKIKTLEGLFVTLQSFGGELPFFFLNAWVLNRVGHINSMSLTLFLFSAIFLLFSVLDNPVYFLPIAFLNGIAFSTMYATMASYASILAPPGAEATMQGLVGSVYEGLGISLGSLMSGLLFHYLSGEKVFRIYGIAALVLCVLHIFVQHLLKKHQKFSPSCKKVTDITNNIVYTSPEEAIHMMIDEKS